MLELLKGENVMRKSAALLIAMALSVMMYGTSDASWLSKTLDKISNAGTISSSDVNMEPDAKSDRWIKVEENDLYTTYIDRRTAKASGTAQNREVTAFFKREFTPIGSQWLGDNSNGYVKPDTITYSIYHATYGVNSCRLDFVYRNQMINPQYYDVNGNLIYKGNLPDIRYQPFGSYIPDSMQERLKDRLFHAFGWDY